LNKNKNIKKSIDMTKELARKVVENFGFILWDVKFLKEGSTWYLRIFIDKDGGVTIDNCKKMSRALDRPLDELDPIEILYCLEVCSPGIERELFANEHFEKYLNNDIAITLIRPNNQGNKKTTAKLQGFEKSVISIQTANKQIEKINRQNIAHIKRRQIWIVAQIS
jgi:ribosome maturation factor RimP